MRSPKSLKKKKDKKSTFLRSTLAVKPERNKMGAVRKFVDALLFVFFLVIAVAAPLFDAQTCLPETFFPKSLVDLKNWYSVEYGDYLVREKPGFFVGLVWVELLFAWPLSLLNLYALVAGASWLPTTCLIYGASTLTAMVFPLPILFSFFSFLFCLLNIRFRYENRFRKSKIEVRV